MKILLSSTLWRLDTNERKQLFLGDNICLLVTHDRMVVGIITTYAIIAGLRTPLMLWVRIPLRRGLLNTTLCDKVSRWLATGRWFSPGTPVSSTNKTDCHDITAILLKVALNTIILTHVGDLCPMVCAEYSRNLFLCRRKLNS